jgi:hypothetical protein
MGEKYIQLVKPIWSGIQKNWHRNVLDTLLQQMSIERVLENFIPIDGVVLNSTNKDKMHFTYSSKHKLQQSYGGQHPISIIQLHNGDFYASIRQNKYVQLICGLYYSTHVGAHYHYWTLNNVRKKFTD